MTFAAAKEDRCAVCGGILAPGDAREYIERGTTLAGDAHPECARGTVAADLGFGDAPVWVEPFAPKGWKPVERDVEELPPAREVSEYTFYPDQYIDGIGHGSEWAIEVAAWREQALALRDTTVALGRLALKRVRAWMR